MSRPADLSKVPFLYLTTTGRKTSLPRRIEIWFVRVDQRFYILAEHFDRTQWVKNIRANPRVRVRVGDHEVDATARILDRERDAEAWQRAQRLSEEKYGWGAGLPVELTSESDHDP